MKQRILTYTVIILSVMYFYSSEPHAEPLNTFYISAGDSDSTDQSSLPDNGKQFRMRFTHETSDGLLFKGQYDWQNRKPRSSSHTEAKYQSIFLDAGFIRPITESTKIYATLSKIRAEGKFTNSTYGIDRTATINGDGFGIGLSHQFSENIKTNFDFHRLKYDTGVIHRLRGLSVDYKLTKDIDLTAEYELLPIGSNDLSYWHVGATYHF